MRNSVASLTRICLQQVYTGYQSTKSTGEDSAESLELYEEESISTAKRGSLYSTVSVSSLKAQDQSIASEKKLNEARRSIRQETTRTVEEPKIFVPEPSPITPATTTTIPVMNPFFTPAAPVVPSALSFSPMAPSQHVSPISSPFQPMDGASAPTTPAASFTLQPSPFASTAFGNACAASIPNASSVSNTIAQAMNPRAASNLFQRHNRRYKDVSSMTPKQQKICQKKLSDIVVREIMMQFRLYKDEERVIPMHLTKINSSLCDESVEYLGEKGGLLKFMKDRPKYFRVKRMAKSGGWYVTTSVDMCEKFAGNFHRSVKSSVYGEVVASPGMEEKDAADTHDSVSNESAMEATSSQSDDADLDENDGEEEDESVQGDIPDIMDEEGVQAP